jgi:hypothetical protein
MLNPCEIPVPGQFSVAVFRQVLRGFAPSRENFIRTIEQAVQAVRDPVASSFTSTKGAHAKAQRREGKAEYQKPAFLKGR